MSQQEPEAKQEAQVTQYTVKHAAFQQNELFDRVGLRDEEGNPTYVDTPGGVASLTEEQVNTLTSAGYEVEPAQLPVDSEQQPEYPDQSTAESGEEVK